MQNLCGEEEKLSNNIYKEHFEFSSGDAVLPLGLSSLIQDTPCRWNHMFRGWLCPGSPSYVNDGVQLPGSNFHVVVLQI